MSIAFSPGDQVLNVKSGRPAKVVSASGIMVTVLWGSGVTGTFPADYFKHASAAAGPTSVAAPTVGAALQALLDAIAAGQDLTSATTAGRAALATSNQGQTP